MPTVFEDELIDWPTIGLVDRAYYPVERISTDIQVSPVPDGVRAAVGSLTSGVGVAGTAAGTYAVLVAEVIRAAEDYVPNLQYGLSLADTAAILEQVYKGIPVSLTSGVGMGLTQVVTQAARIVDALILSRTVTPSTHYQLSLVDQLRVASSLGQFFGADIVEGVGIAEALSTLRLTYNTLTEGVELAEDPPEGALLLRISVTDGVAIEFDQLVEMVYSDALGDGIEITAAYAAPDGNFTTWAINTRTGAVTEYSNYNFNSYAMLDGKFIAASSDPVTGGIYELLGDDDAGAGIVARIKGGLLQFGGPRLSRLSTAYIATRGAGDFVLKIVDGDGTTYNYGITTQSMRSTRVHMGKGQRSRYFSFELISAGQDFDLDTLEFVPIVVNRRV